MLLFRSEEHVERWCRQWGASRGETLSGEQIWGLAYAWYSPDRRLPDWRQYSKEEAEKIFADLGLITPFWRL